MKKANIPWFYGISIGIGVIAFFLVFSMFGLHTNPMYSLFNLVIMGVGLFLVISRYKQKTAENFKYEYGFSVIFGAGMIATFIVTGFFALYFTELNPDFLKELRPVWKNDSDLLPGMAIFRIASMGFSISLIMSLVYMQLFKGSRNTKEGEKHTL